MSYSLLDGYGEVVDLLSDMLSMECEGTMREWSGAAWLAQEGRPPTLVELNLTKAEATRILSDFLTVLIGDAAQEIVNEPFLHVDVRHAQLAESTGAADLGRELREHAAGRWMAYLVNGDAQQLWKPWFQEDAGHLTSWVFPRAAVLAKERLEALRRSGPPALSLTVMEGLHGALLDRRRSLRVGVRWAVIDRHQRQVATLAPPPAIPAGDKALAATQSLAAHRLLVWLVDQGHAQALARETRDFRTIRVAGGLSGLAQILGMRSRKAPGELHDALRVFQHAELELPGRVVGGLLTWTTREAAPGRPAEVRITLGDPLLPGYVRSLSKGGGSRREARMLIPLPSLNLPLPVHVRHQAAALRLAHKVVGEIRFLASQLVRDHWVRISERRWMELAEAADVPSALIPVLHASWTCETPARFLERSVEDPDLWRLGEFCELERAFIEAAGVEEERGRLRQGRSRRARARTGEGTTRRPRGRRQRPQGDSF